MVKELGSVNAKQAFVKKRCDARSTQVGETILKLLGDDAMDMDIHATSALLQETMLKVLLAVPSFKRLRISNSARQKSVKQRGPKKPDQQSVIKIAEKELNQALVRGITKNNSLVTVEFDALSNLFTKKIPVALKAAVPSLKSIIVRSMPIDAALFSKIAQTLSSGEVNYWEFDGCGLSDTSAIDFAKLISIHNTRRDVARYQDELRSDQPCSPINTKGILGISLPRNHLTDEGVRSIVAALEDDKWVRALDFTSNDLTNDAVLALLGLLLVNRVICSITLDDIAGLDRTLTAELEHHLAQRRDNLHGEDIIAQCTPNAIPFASRNVRHRGNSSRSVSPIHRKVAINVPSPTVAVSGTRISAAIEHLSTKTGTDSEPGALQELIGTVLTELQGHSNVHAKMLRKMHQVEAENAALKEQVESLSANKRGRTRPVSAPPVKSQSGKAMKVTVKRANSSSKTRTPGAKAKAAAPSAGARRSNAHELARHDIDQMQQLVSCLETLFQCINLFLDEQEKSLTGGGAQMTEERVKQFLALSNEVKKSAGLFGSVATRINSLPKH